MPLTHGIGSYCGTLTFAVSAPREMLPDPTVYADCLERSFEALRDRARGSGRGRPTEDRRGRETSAWHGPGMT